MPGLERGAARYAISISMFRTLVQTVAEQNCCTIGSFHGKSGGNWVILSFDDGLISDYEKAFPILEEKGLKATFFITVENIGHPGYMDAGQIRKMASCGMEIGSHGLQHRYLVTLPESEARREICVSKDKLEQMLGSEVHSFAPVGGHYKRWMVDFAKESGYRAFASMIPGRTLKYENEGFLFRRNHIQSHHNLSYISSLIAGERNIFIINVLRYHALALPKRILGMQTYDRLKHFIVREEAN
jgi:peptidoglycan/xylan/chitin deacetylase (PgdA/CDA1 family)